MKKSILLFFIICSLTTCKKENNIDADALKLKKLLGLNEFLDLKVVKLLDEYEYPKTIFFRTRVEKEFYLNLLDSLDIYIDENSLPPDCYNDLSEFYKYEMMSFTSIYSTNENILKIEKAFFYKDKLDKRYSICFLDSKLEEIFGCRNKGKGRMILFYNNFIIYGIVDLIE